MITLKNKKICVVTGGNLAVAGLAFEVGWQIGEYISEKIEEADRKSFNDEINER